MKMVDILIGNEIISEFLEELLKKFKEEKIDINPK